METLSNQKPVNAKIIKEGVLEKINFLKEHRKTFFDEKQKSFVFLQKDIPKKVILQNKRKVWYKDFHKFPQAVWKETYHINPETDKKCIAFTLAKDDIAKIQIFYQKYYSNVSFKKINELLKEKFNNHFQTAYIIKTTFNKILNFQLPSHVNLKDILFLINKILNLSKILKFKFNPKINCQSFWLNNYKNDFYEIIHNKGFKNAWKEDTNKNDAKLKNLKILRDLLTHLDYKKEQESKKFIICNDYFLTDDYIFLELFGNYWNNEKKKICKILIEQFSDIKEKFIKLFIKNMSLKS